MSGERGHLGAKAAREVFLTSSSLSFSSLSSSCASWDDTIELNTKASTTSCEDQKGQLLRVSSRGSEMSCVTHVKMQPAPSPPSGLRPVELMDRGLGPDYDPQRIPASAFGKSGDLNWSEISNDESLFSLRMSICYQAFCQSNIKPEEGLMSGDFFAYSPPLLVKPDDAEEKRFQVKETKSVVTSVETNTHRDKSSSSTPPVASLSTIPTSFYQLYQAPPRKAQSFSSPVSEKKNKKIKKTRKSKTAKKKKKEKKEKKNMCCLWSWLFSGFPKCKCNLRCCYKWRKCCCCCRGSKAAVL